MCAYARAQQEQQLATGVLGSGTRTRVPGIITTTPAPATSKPAAAARHLHLPAAGRKPEPLIVGEQAHPMRVSPEHRQSTGYGDDLHIRRHYPDFLLPFAAAPQGT
jgi:hypothetical protein